MQKIVTLDGFGVRTVVLERVQFFWTGRLIVKVLQTFEFVRGVLGPRISILGLMIGLAKQSAAK